MTREDDGVREFERLATLARVAARGMPPVNRRSKIGMHREMTFCPRRRFLRVDGHRGRPLAGCLDVPESEGSKRRNESRAPTKWIAPRSPTISRVRSPASFRGAHREGAHRPTGVLEHGGRGIFARDGVRAGAGEPHTRWGIPTR